MPIIQSAIKRARQAEVRRVRRQPFKTQMKTMMKKLVDLANAGKKEEGAKLLPAVFKAIDTAAKKQIIHKNNADRKKALMARLVSTK
jgi:small subunit ribosomal protein S20